MALQAWLLSLLAAQKDWRLALLRLGHMHHVGNLEVTPDLELSYAYYINIARQSNIDQKNPSPQQVRYFLFSAIKGLIAFKIKYTLHIFLKYISYVYIFIYNINYMNINIYCMRMSFIYTVLVKKAVKINLHC